MEQFLNLRKDDKVPEKGGADGRPVKGGGSVPVKGGVVKRSVSKPAEHAKLVSAVTATASDVQPDYARSMAETVRRATGRRGKSAGPPLSRSASVGVISRGLNTPGSGMSRDSSEDRSVSRPESPLVTNFRAMVAAEAETFRKPRAPGPKDADEAAPAAARKKHTEMTSVELVDEVGEAVGEVLLVSKTSRTLPGCFQKKINDAVHRIRNSVGTLAAMREPEEAVRLRSDKKRLEAEVELIKIELLAFKKSNEELGRQIAEMRHGLGPRVVEAPARPAPPEPADFEALINAAVERASERMFDSTARLIDGRLAGLEDRLLPAPIIRPPLASDKRRAEAASSSQPPAPASSARTRPAAHPAPRQAPAPASRPGPALSKTAAAPRPRPTSSAVVDVGMEVDAAPPTGPSGEEGTWAQAVGRKKKGRAARKARAAAAPPPAAAPKAAPAKKGPKLAPPKTAAVIVKLRPEAVAGGKSYREVMDSLNRTSALEDLGLKGSVRVRHTMAGARIFELGASHSAELADQLAARMRVTLEGVADVVRPVKTADLRVTELDDSATQESVVAAVVAATECPAGQVRVLTIRDGPAGMGTTIITCPVAVAKILADRGRIIHGWTVARVVALEQRALRCFNCMAIGHTSATCPSPGKCRKDTCFRCGAEGHKVGTCTAAYRCAVCADSGRKCDHLMGGRACFPPRIKGRNAAGAPPRTADKPAQGPPAGGEQMAVN